MRLSTPQGKRLAQTEQFEVAFGGGEANVAISLANYGHQTIFASKVPNNALGEAVKRHLNFYDVKTTQLLKGGTRLGTYYLETGVGERASSVIYDRAGSSFAEMVTIEWQLDELFEGADLFHISGITPALSESWQHQTLELIKEAKKRGCLISFDINYRSKLWTQETAGKVLEKLLPFVDICSAGKMDAQYLLGINPSIAESSTKDKTIYYYRCLAEKFPNVYCFYSTNREVLSASCNRLTGTMWYDGQYYESQCHEIDPIVDRVGGGDAFSSGVLHGILEGFLPQTTICFATAAAALKHTVQGDCNQFSEEEVQEFLLTGSGKIIR